jgi:predicted metal-dependent peptidase
MSEVTFTNKDLGTLMMTLQRKGEALYTAILFQCVREVSEEIPTAGVAFHNGKFRLWASGKFFSGLSDREKLGVLKHEAMHLVFQHCTQRRTEDKSLLMLDNYAADCAINSLLDVCELPKCGVIPGQASSMPEPDVWEKWSEEQREWFTKFSAFIESLPVGESREWYFNKFLENEDIKDALQSPGGDLGDVLDALGFDDHDGWGDDGSEEAAAAKAKLREIIERAVNECQKTGQWGSIPQAIRERIIDSLQPEIDWRRQLRNWVGMTRRGNRATTWRRPNKRCPGLMPQGRISWTASIGVFIDQSGSVSDAELAEGWGEIAGMARRRRIDAIPFDTEVGTEHIQEIKRGSRFNPSRVSCGGTCFRAVMDYAKKNRSEYDGIIIFTDGEAADPGPPLRGQRRLWLLSSQGNLLFNPHPGDTVIKLTGKKE